MSSLQPVGRILSFGDEEPSTPPPVRKRGTPPIAVSPRNSPPRKGHNDTTDDKTVAAAAGALPPVPSSSSSSYAANRFLPNLAAFGAPIASSSKKPRPPERPLPKAPKVPKAPNPNREYEIDEAASQFQQKHSRLPTHRDRQASGEPFKPRYIPQDSIKQKMLNFIGASRYEFSALGPLEKGEELGRGMNAITYTVKGREDLVVKVYQPEVLEEYGHVAIAAMHAQQIRNYHTLISNGIECARFISDPTDPMMVWERVPHDLGETLDALIKKEENFQTKTFEELSPELQRIYRQLHHIFSTCYRLVNDPNYVTNQETSIGFNADLLAENLRVREDGTVVFIDQMEIGQEDQQSAIREMHSCMEKYLIGYWRGNKHLWDYLCPSIEHKYDKLFQD